MVKSAYGRAVFLLAAVSLLFFAPARGAAATGRTYNLHLLMLDPVMDGNVEDDPAWTGIPASVELVFPEGYDYGGNRTFFRAGYGFEALCVGIERAEPETDMLEIILGPARGGYYRFKIDASGSRRGYFTGFFEDGSVHVEEIEPGGWEAAVSPGASCRSAEFRIPFELLGDSLPAENEQWGFNVIQRGGSLPPGEPAVWSPFAPGTPPDSGRIIFTDTVAPEERPEAEDPDDAEYFVYSSPAEGTQYINMTDISGGRISHSRAWYVAPAMSPCRKKILYHSLIGGEPGIWVAGINGQEARRLCGGGYAAWSPSGENIVFQRDGRIIERSVGTGEERRVTPEDWTRCRFPSYASEEEIIFAVESRGVEKIYSARAGGTPELVLEAGGGIPSRPAVSPCGGRVAYQDGAHIYILDTGSGRRKRVTSTGGVHGWPVWSRDGGGICYMRAPESAGELYDLCYVDLGSPRRTGLIMRNLYPSFHWDGVYPDPLGIARWTETNEMKLDISRSADGALAAGNRWFEAVFGESADRIILRPAGAKEGIGIGFLDGRGRFFPIEDAVIASSDDDESAVIDVSLAGGAVLSSFFRRGKTGARIKVSRYNPFIEILPLGNMPKIFVEKQLGPLVLPDRFAHDIVFPPPGCGEPSALSLPYAPFVMDLFEWDEKGMLIAVTPGEAQRVVLSSGRNGEVPPGMTIEPAGEPVFLSLLHGGGLWSEKPVESRGDNAPGVRWEQPFRACWRMTAADGTLYSRMWRGEQLHELAGGYLPVETSAPESPGSVIIYLYGRDERTPADTRTPMDVIYDALGTKRAGELLDIEGLRKFHAAENWVPLEMYTGHFEQDLDVRSATGLAADVEAGEAMVFGGVRLGTESSYNLLINLHDDIISILRAADERAGEYREFLSSLGGDFPPDAAGLIEKYSGPPELTPTDEIVLSAGEIRSMSGLARNDERFVRFLERSREAARERMKLLSGCRELVKRLRVHAGRESVRAGCAADYEPLREEAAGILRKRHYFEGGWEGEKPLFMGEF